MNQVPASLLQDYSRDFIATRHASARRHGTGGTSPCLVALAHVAGAFAALAHRVEAWARGPAEATARDARADATR
ncbi:MAG: hypothetical protein ACR2HN_09750 [Tepidiformaceae bacterium]